MENLTQTLENKTSVESVKISGSEAVMRSLLAEGVNTIFGYPGGAIMPIYDALYHYTDKLQHILTRHEQGAIHAAQGYSRVTGKVGVCMATSGPGATNLITGIADAMIDSTPLVCITGQVPSHLLGTDAFQETDIIGISIPVTKWNYQVTSADEIPEALAKAFYIAQSGRPGPVLIDITKDAQFAELDFKYEHCKSLRSYNPAPKPKISGIQEAATLINQAKKPYILAGQGVLIAQAEQQLKQLAETAGIPVASTLLGLSALPKDHPLYVGMLGMHGNYGPNVLTNECDLLIAIGMRFDDRVTGRLDAYATQAKVIHIEIDPSEINKNVKADVPLVGDAAKTLNQLLPLIQPNKHKSWVRQFQDFDQIEYEKVIKRETHPKEGEIKMAEVIRFLNEETKGKAVLVTDVGQHQMIATRYYHFQDPKTNVTSGGLGTMGFALPSALGAKLGVKNTREVICIVGDGGIQMTIQELATMAQFGIAVKIIVLNNSFLGMVRQWQQLFHEKRYSSTEMVNPDFIAVAKGFGLEAEKVTVRQELNSALKRMLEHNGPYLMEVVVEKEDNVFPMIPSGEAVNKVRLS
ncbi:biosynthetic-type acetolactate synthase large subunit [Xanthovirga aplysinae]|uniref:biosynthetic-type acetolactate synthase large subunit n=1 Tax=Xanthovirga aplysinae TaxID=2529853 RepID=UPI0012BCB7F9|nr:biosynthetic-type acetolactate synthase large subunit [Xanthovirga aplysinae]MTI33530.1 biosynthetic-type acetolactate synthase large subunit [Xanthovirga aplysinae]